MLKHRFFTLLFLFVLTTALLFSTAAAAPDGADGSTAEAPLTVPEEGYRHSGSAISGIDDTWLAEQKAALGLDPDSDAIYLHLEIPAEIDGQAIQSIAAKSFRDGTYQLVSADFTHASNLQSIGNQAFYTRSELGGTIDLSQTKLRSIADNYALAWYRDDCPDSSRDIEQYWQQCLLWLLQTGQRHHSGWNHFHRRTYV